MDLDLVRAFISYVLNVAHNAPFMNYEFQVELVEGQQILWWKKKQILYPKMKRQRDKAASNATASNKTEAL